MKTSNKIKVLVYAIEKLVASIKIDAEEQGYTACQCIVGTPPLCEYCIAERVLSHFARLEQSEFAKGMVEHHKKASKVTEKALRKFPLLGEKGNVGSIPWWIAEQAYIGYANKYGDQQSLERLAERGGFGISELNEYYPGWKDECNIIKQIQAELACSRLSNKAFRGDLKLLESKYKTLQAEKAQEKGQAVKFLYEALPHIECRNHFQSGLITAIGTFLDALKKGGKL